jgi:hypothetical protein
LIGFEGLEAGLREQIDSTEDEAEFDKHTEAPKRAWEAGANHQRCLAVCNC